MSFQNPSISSGQVVRQAQVARDDGAGVQTPAAQSILFQPTQPSGPFLSDIGTNGRLRSLATTQATPPNSIAFVQDPITRALPITSGVSAAMQAAPQTIRTISAGIGSAGDDSAGFLSQITSPTASSTAGASRTDDTSIANATQTAIDQVFGDSAITAQPNVLDQYSSYTYSISFYMITPEDYGRMVETKSLSAIPSNRLLFQSGGVNSQSGKRNQFFQLDYFIDTLNFTTVMAQNAERGASSSTTFDMSVIETNGITLLQNLQNACYELNGTSSAGSGSQQQPAIAQNYLIVIKFYGYDDAGNLVRGGQQYGGATDTAAMVEKYFPVRIKNIKFKVTNKITEYELDMYSVNMEASAGLRTALPYNYEVSGTTVKEVLLGPVNANTTASSSGGGRANDTTTGVPPTPPSHAAADSSAKPTVRQGLIQALNANQQKMVKDGIQQYADTFEVQFTSSSISEAKILVQDGEKKGTGVASNATAPQQILPDKQSVDNTTRQISFTSGTSTLQMVEQVIRNSTYVTDQSNTVVSEKTGQATPNLSSGKNFAWFKVNLQAIPQKWDEKRKDYAYKYMYVVSPFKVNQVKSQYFNESGQVKGVHKRYDYLFTGLNSQVLSFDIEINNLYQVLMTGALTSDQAPPQIADKRTFAPSSASSSQGAAGKTNQIGASAADYLYEPTSAQKVTLNIIGDPAWMTQGADAVLDTDILSTGSAFLPDGTINADIQEVLFEIIYGTPQDYDLNTGLMDPNKRPLLYPTGTAPQGAGAQSQICAAQLVKHEFNKGKFTQTISGRTIKYFPDQTVRAAQAENRPVPTQSGASSRTSPTVLPAQVPEQVNPSNVRVPTSGTTTNPPNPQVQYAPPPTPPSSNGDITLATAPRNLVYTQQQINREL